MGGVNIPSCLFIEELVVVSIFGEQLYLILDIADLSFDLLQGL